MFNTKTAAHTDQSTLAKLKLLYLEDDPFAATMQIVTLTQNGYEVTHVNTGEKAVALINRGEYFDLGVFDLDLGNGIDGPEAARQILIKQDMPIVFMSGHTEPDVINRVEAITNSVYIPKGSNIISVNQALKSALKMFETKLSLEKLTSALMESEERYRLAFHTHPDAININALNGIYKDINQGFTQLTGYSQDDVLGRASLEIDIWTIPEDRAKLIKGLQENGFVSNLESVFKCKDGSLKTAVMSASIFKFKNEPHILSITHDITALKQTQEALRTSEIHHRGLIDLAVDGILTGSNEGIILSANRQFCQMMGLSSEELIGRHISSLPFTPESITQHPLRFDLLQKGEIVVSERRIRRSDNTEIIIEMHSKMMPDGTYQSIYRDITERTLAEIALQESERKFRSLFDQSSEAIFEVDLATGKYYDVNHAAEVLTGRSRRELLSLKTVDVSPKKSQARLKKITQIPGSIAFGLVEYLRPDGTVRFVELKTTIPLANGHTYGIGHDMTEIKLAEEQKKLQDAELIKQATIEPITELPNEYLLKVAITERLQQAQTPFYLARLHISNFGQVGSIYGKAVADDYLRQRSVQLKKLVVEILPESKIFRSINMAGFDLLLPTADPEMVKGLGALCKNLFKTPLKVGNSEIQSSIVVGACAHTLVSTAQDILDKSDLAIQKAKKVIQHDLQLYDHQLMTEVQNEELLLAQVGPALARGELIPYYQPQVSITGEIIAYEVLARWIKSSGEIVAPKDFMAAIKTKDLLGNLFESMLEQVCAHISTIPDKGLKYSVNVSPVQFAHAGFVERTMAIVQRFGIDPKRIKFEILEDAVLIQDSSLKAIEKLHDAGFTFALDDFGFGLVDYTVVRFLLKARVLETIKLAREVINSILIDGVADADETVSGILFSARKWGVKIVAEGVETLEELVELNRLCNEVSAFPAKPLNISIQGYYFSKPKPFEEIVASGPDIYKDKSIDFIK